MTKTYSDEELARSDGKEKRSALVAVDGKVYDVSGSGMWAEGEHMGAHQAGEDLTEAIQGAPHGVEVLGRVQEVGTLGGGEPAAADAEKSVSPEELDKGDGQEGRPALVAVDGEVYDVSGSGMWSGGSHMSSHRAGRDLSLALQAAPHGREVLERVEKVGVLAEPPPEARVEAPRVPAWASRVLAFHPHPVTVHFPIALCAAAALFMGLYLVCGCPSLETAVIYNLGLATLASPPAILAGLLSWKFNYGGVWTPIFRKKAVLSVFLMLLAPAALALRLALPGTFAPGGSLQWAYTALVVVTAPCVFGLGFLGGNITFPR